MKPDQVEALKRQVAVDAERSWWIRKLREHIARLEPMARTTTNVGHALQIEIESLDALIAERER